MSLAGRLLGCGELLSSSPAAPLGLAASGGVRGAAVPSWTASTPLVLFGGGWDPRDAPVWTSLGTRCPAGRQEEADELHYCREPSLSLLLPQLSRPLGLCTPPADDTGGKLPPRALVQL